MNLKFEISNHPFSVQHLRFYVSAVVRSKTHYTETHIKLKNSLETFRVPFIVAITFFLLSLSPVALAQDKLLTIDDIYDPIKKVSFSGSPPLRLRWLKSGTHYVQNKQASENGAAHLVKVDARTGEATPFYDAAKMEAALAKVSGMSAAEAKRLARLASYEMNEAETAVLLKHNRDLFHYELGGDKATRLTNNPEEETNEEFSPDGRTVAFVRGNNLY